jgi:Ca2+/Na+ antiporter
MSRAVICILLFVIGVAFLFPFDHPITLLAGVAFLFAFVIYGVFTIASPEFLAAGDEQEKPVDHRSEER